MRGGASHGTSSLCTCPFWVLPFFIYVIYLCGVPNKAVKKVHMIIDNYFMRAIARLLCRPDEKTNKGRRTDLQCPRIQQWQID